MGKKRIVKKGAEVGGVKKPTPALKLSRKKLEKGVLHVQATYNNTKLLLADESGGSVTWSSSGGLGFKGAKKGTPFAAAKVGEVIGNRAKTLGVKEVNVVVKGFGSGRESSIRAFLTRSGAALSSIQDRTPIPFNGPKPRKARRV